GDRRAPRKETIHLLAEALALSEADRAAFAAAARQQRSQVDQARPGPPGSAADADASRPIPAAQSASVTTPLRRQLLEWISRYLERVRSPDARLGGRLSGGVLSVLMVALLGSAILLRGEPGVGTAPWRVRQLCGGALALATDLPTSGIDGATQGKSVENAVNL